MTTHPKIKYLTESIKLQNESITIGFDDLPEKEKEQFITHLQTIHQNMLYLYTQILENHIKTA